MENKETTLNEDLKFVRQVLGLRQSNFAKLVGCATETINSIEKGGKIERSVLGRIYVSFMVLLTEAKADNTLLREEEIYTIDKLQDRLVKELNRTAKDYKLIIKR